MPRKKKTNVVEELPEVVLEDDDLDLDLDLDVGEDDEVEEVEITFPEDEFPDENPGLPPVTLLPVEDLRLELVAPLLPLIDPSDEASDHLANVRAHKQGEKIAEDSLRKSYEWLVAHGYPVQIS